MNDDSKKSNNESGGSSEHYQSRLESVETIGDSGHAPLPPLQIENDIEQHTANIHDDAIKKSAMSGIRSAMNNNQRVQQVHHASSGFGSSRLRTTRPRNDEIDRTTATSSSTQYQSHNTFSASGVSIDEEQNISQGTGGSIDEEATTELVPLDAVVVEEEIEVPVYDGVVIQPDDDNQQAQAQATSCIKRNQKCLVVVLILVIVAMAAIVGGVLGTQSKNDINENDESSSNASGEILVASSTTSAPSPLFRKSTSLPSLSPSLSLKPTSSTPTLQPISPAPTKPLYYADWSNRRCSNDPENKPSSNLGQQLYERVEDCCTAAFYYLTGYDCILASLDITKAPTLSPTTRSPSSRPTFTPSLSPLSPTGHPTTSLRPTNGSSPPSMYLPSLDWVQVGQSILGEGSNDWAGRSVSLSKDGLILAVGASRHDNANGNNAGHVQIYTLIGDSWQKFGNFIEGGQTGDWFGHSVSLSGDGLRIAVGAQYADSGNGLSSGKVKVYEYDASSSDWIKLGQDVDGNAGDELGTSLTLSSDGMVLAIGVPKSDANGVDSGQVRVYSWDTDTWSRMGNSIDGVSSNDQFGRSVALSSSGNILAIGSPGAEQVRMFFWDERLSNWQQLGQNLAGTLGDKVGTSVALSSDGKMVVYGAPGSSSGGYVRVYKFQSTSWVEVGDKIEDGSLGDKFGYSVSINDDGTTILVGSSSSNVNGAGSGSVQSYIWDSENWQRKGKRVQGEEVGDEFGTSVSISGNGSSFIAGSPFSDINGSNSGSAAVFNIENNR